MGWLSIRGIDEKLAALLKEAAALEHKSVNQCILEIIKDGWGCRKKSASLVKDMIWTTPSADGQR